MEQETQDAQTLEIGEEDIEITPYGDGVWKVRIVFTSQVASDQEMVTRMRVAKRLISEQYGIPIELLEFQEILDKSASAEGFVAQVLIHKIVVRKGKPVVRLKNIQTPRGELLQDMIAEIDFYYLDEFEQLVSVDRLKLEMRRKGIDLEVCNMRIVEEALEKVLEEKSLVKGLEFGWGELPENGFDAEIEYTFHTDPGEAQDLIDFRSSRRVNEGGIICQKIPPKHGIKSGRNVRGEAIPPIQGFDFELAAGDGCKLSADGNDIKALRDGIAILSRTNRRVYTLAGERIVPEKIEVTIKPLVELNAEDIVDVALEDSVEIVGDLRDGSSIVTEGEVFLGGDVEKGTKVIAGQDVIVDGYIWGGEISTEGSLFSSEGLENAVITADEDVNIKGIIQSSDVAAKEIKATKIEGSKVEAGQKIVVDRISNDSLRRRTTIKLGRKDYYQHKLKANQEAVVTMQESMEKIQEIFGPELITKLQGTNQQHLLIAFLKELRTRGVTNLDAETIETLKRLLNNVDPLRNIISEKEEEMDNIKQKAEEESDQKPIVVIRERIQDDIVVDINGKTNTVKSTSKGIVITVNEQGDIEICDIPTPKSKRSRRRKTAAKTGGKSGK